LEKPPPTTALGHKASLLAVLHSLGLRQDEKRNNNNNNNNAFDAFIQQLGLVDVTEKLGHRIQELQELDPKNYLEMGILRNDHAL
jgi:hypothetical protein